MSFLDDYIGSKEWQRDRDQERSDEALYKENNFYESLKNSKKESKEHEQKNIYISLRAERYHPIGWCMNADNELNM